MNMSITRNRIIALALTIVLALSLFSFFGLQAADAATTVGAVTGLKAMHRDDDSVDLTWRSVPDATGYEVSRYSTTHGEWDPPYVTDWNSFEMDDLPSATVIKFRVRAYVENADGTLTYGDYDTYTTCTSPNEVGNLHASNKTSTSVTLKWSASKRADHYQVYRYNSSSGTWTRVITTTKTSYTVKNLKSGTSYRFRVRAYRTVDSLNSKYHSDYESITVKTASAGSSGSSGGSSSGGMSVERAKSIALKDAGYSASQVDFVMAHLDYDDGRQIYEVEFYVGDYEFSYDISTSGKIIERDRDYRWD